MIRRFLPLTFPALIVTVFAAVSYGFWKKNMDGSAMIDLPPVVLGGESVGVSHPSGLEPEDPAFTWMISVSRESYARLGSLEFAYGGTERPPGPAAWVTLSTGAAFGSFRVAPPMPDSPGPGERCLWIRVKGNDGLQPVPVVIRR